MSSSCNSTKKEEQFEKNSLGDMLRALYHCSLDDGLYGCHR